jgi:hypothetical protein
MKWMTVDPGEATGVSLWEDDKLIDAYTIPLWEFIHMLGYVLMSERVDADSEYGSNSDWQGIETLVVEDWALYPWKLKSLAWDKCRTARGIGALEYICDINHINFILQPAAIKKTAVAGGAEDLFYHPLHENRHQNDAIMHGVYYLVQMDNEKLQRQRISSQQSEQDAKERDRT